MKLLLRTWRRSPLSSFISLLSLAIGLLCSTILLLFTVTEFRMAKSLGNDSNVYVVEQISNNVAALNMYSPVIKKELIAEIADKYPEIIAWTVIGQHDWKWQYDFNHSYDGSSTLSVTPGFTKFITIPMEEGCMDSILKHPNAIAITRTYANRIFPGENPIGKTIFGDQDFTLDVDGIIYKEIRTLVVEGIIDDSFRSFLNFRAIFSRSEDNVRTVPHAEMFSAFIKLQKGVLPEAFIEKIAADSTLSEKYDRNIRLCPIADAYFKIRCFDDYLFKKRDKNTLYIGLTISLVLLLISVFNYLNITLIRAPKRLKNLAGQRIMGASKREIAEQIIAETALQVLAGFGIALIFMPSAMQLFNSFMGSNLQWQDIFQWNNLPYMIVLLSALILIPAIYLILKFSIKKPMEVFINPTGNKVQYLGSLVVLQMVISVVLITFSINIKKEMEHILSIVPEAHKIICITDYKDDLSKSFMEHLKQSTTTTEFLPGGFYPNHSKGNDKGETYFFTITQPNFFDFFRISILSGRVFDSISSNPKQVVVNKAFIKSKDIKDEPIGYEFAIYENHITYRIVGICEDFHYDNATLSVPPTLYILKDEDYGEYKVNIRFQGTLENKIKEIQELFEKYAELDDVEFDEAFLPEISTLADYYIKQNLEIKRLKIMVEFFALISIFLSAMGLFGLSWYTVERRHKEIALRKVHGATTGKLLVMLCKTFFIWCAIATIIALPIGYYISKYWLEGFVYRIDNSLWTLVLTAIIAALVTFFTVIFQTARAATANPAKFIKME